ncbi:MAG: imidazole glycerol phosphate synthase subunit HisH [Planctomycetaceae bacterium]|nr:imidazole glycerol phosphate synthase subunit HisH [Planctomycetaceae bacterium]
MSLQAGTTPQDSPGAGLRIQIVDYRLGNLFSVLQACRQVGFDAFVSASPDQLNDVDGILLPGVGAFGNAMENLHQLGLLEALRTTVLAGKPMFGICLGMQLLFEESEEFGQHEGLGLLPGRIRRLPEQQLDGRKLRVPNIGWHRIQFTQASASHPLRNGIADGQHMYFVHSYYAAPAASSDCLTMTQYGNLQYCSGVARDNIVGVQFHPEKSAQEGLLFYRNWAHQLRERKEQIAESRLRNAA